MGRRATAVAALSGAALIFLVGLACLLYGGYLAAIVDSAGNAPSELGGYIFCIVGMGIMGAGMGVGKMIGEHYEASGFDPVDDFMIVVIVVSGVLMAAAAVAIAVAIL